MTSPSALDIQHHLYQSFLQASTADVSVRVTGTWKAIYRLHRVVLIQAGFFHSMFTAGFIESSHRRSGMQQIDVTFDDHNITRAAFEVCISRLYGGGPPLHIPPSLIPTLSYPLTPSFPYRPSMNAPSGHHLASPRFLMSLLATSIYLSIPALASHALSSILNTIGPYTVLEYLAFALGQPIQTSEVDEENNIAAAGLEHVAEIIEDTSSISMESTKSDESEDTSINTADPDVKADSGPNMSDGLPSSNRSVIALARMYHYGPLSDKIGEAAACWLARWGPDFLAFEQGSSLPQDLESSVHIFRRNRTFSSAAAVSDINDSALQLNIPVIWNRGGLSPEWIRALVSSDSLFVKDEHERYILARSIVELRRQAGIVPEEETEWSTMFENSIYFANMTLDDVIQISQDVSASTGRPFVPLSVLQAAHWNFSLLRHQITGQRSSVATMSSGSPPPRDKELGVTLTGEEMASKQQKTSSTEESKFYYRVAGNSSLRLGENGNATSSSTDLSMEQLFTISHTPANNSFSTEREPVPEKNSTISTEEISKATFFGLLPSRHRINSAENLDTKSASQWSPYPPCRFAVEFWDLNHVKEKQRLHSQTIWYAGSLFNVYVQTVKKKNQPQLGIYLHRQSSVDSIPPSSSPNLKSVTRDESTVSSPLSYQHARGPSLPNLLPIVRNTSPVSPSPIHYSPSIHPPNRSTTPIRATTPISPSSSSAPGMSSFPSSFTTHGTSLPATSPGISPEQPYRDPRPMIAAYFVISCFSPTGNSLTRFSSAPDVFKISQSWGWKSSSLRGDEGESESNRGPHSGHETGPISLRATVIIGYV